MRTRAYRRHQRARTKARHLYFIRFVHPWDNYRPKDIATRHPADCGRRCGLCHCDKLYGVAKRRRWEPDALAHEWTATGGWS